MITLLIRVTLGLLVLNHLFTPCIALRSSGGRGYSAFKSGKYEGNSNQYRQNVGTYGSSSGSINNGIPEPSQGARRGLGISAWGIVMVIVTMFIAGMGFYYFSICYPILCKKERKYDIMQMPKV